LIFLETAKEKVWKSLEKFGNPRNFLGKVWQSLKKLDVAALRPPAAEGRKRDTKAHSNP
jgi:hypothetical protein